MPSVQNCFNMITTIWRCVILFLLVCECVSATLFTECGGVLTGSRGYIQTPNFPHKFPIPMSCQWVIHAPPENKIVLYFTQFYVKKHFTLSEYDLFESTTSFTGKNALGEIDFEDAVTTLTAYKPYVVIDFKVRDASNIHLRVEEYLQDVYGFNITYENLPLNESRRESCSVDQCSYLGNCVANHDYTAYHCECFDNFSGDECQYGPYCNPAKGLNQCENNGKCRYFYGSTVNTCVCPPGYDGVKCEIRKKGYFDDRCSLNCSDRCEQANNGSFFCACDDGFKLIEDGRTCVEREIFRVNFFIPLRNGTSATLLEHPALNPGPVRFVTTKFTRIFLKANFSTATKAKFDGIRMHNNKRMLCFLFFIEYEEVSVLKARLPELTRYMTTSLERDLRDFFGVYVMVNESEIAVEPDAKLLYVSTFDHQPSLEGGLLTINCAAKGSKNMKFRWYNDGSLLNTTLSKRNAWQIHIPQTIDGKQSNVLNIDGMTFYDKGTFTCEIIDFNRSQTASVTVDVMTYPVLDLHPRSRSVIKGQRLNFRCLSPDDTKGTFSYKWLKNGEILSGTDEEVVEKVQPIGERLLIPHAIDSASYTCMITNKAGTSKETAFVFVSNENSSAMYCAQDMYKGTTWKRTLGGHFDIQNCPTDTGDLSLNYSGNGFSRRNCQCDGHACVWQKPNFAKCQSGDLIKLFDRLKKIQLGYQIDTMATIWNDMFGIMDKPHDNFYAGDIDVTSSILYNYLTTLLEFNALYSTNDNFSLQSLLILFDFLMEESLYTSDYEKKELFVGPKLLQIIEMVASLNFPGFEFYDGLTLEKNLFVVKVRNLRLGQYNSTVDEADANVKVTSTRSRRRQVSDVQETNKYSSTDGEPEDAEPGEAEPEDADVVDEYITQKMLLFEMKTVFTDLLLDEQTEGIIKPHFISDLQSVSMFDNFDSMETKDVEITFHHEDEVRLPSANETVCVSWQKNQSDLLYGYWSLKGCVVVSYSNTWTKCLCTVPGHFRVIVRSINQTVVKQPENLGGLIMASCILATCGLLVTIIIYLFAWRRLTGDAHTIHINFVLSLLAINIISLVCLGQAGTDTATLCTAVKILLQFFYMAAFSFMFVEAVHVFVQVHAKVSLGRNCLKYFIIGWGIPTIATGCVVIASENYGYDTECAEWCWLFGDHWHLYSFLIPVVILILAHSILLLASFHAVCGWNEEWRFRDCRKQTRNIVTSWILELLLTVMCVSGMLVNNMSNTLFIALFIIFNLTLTVFIILTLIVFKKHVKSSFLETCQSFNKKNNMSWNFPTSSFKAYMMPETTTKPQTIEESIQHHCEEVNRKKYTQERKRQLQHLLGSSVEHTFRSTSSCSNDDYNLEAVPHHDIIGDDSGLGSDEVSYRTTAVLHSPHEHSMLTDSEFGSDDVMQGATAMMQYPDSVTEVDDTRFAGKEKRPDYVEDESEYTTTDPFFEKLKCAGQWPSSYESHTGDIIADTTRVSLKSGALQLFDPTEVKQLLASEKQIYSLTADMNPLDRKMLLLTKENIPLVQGVREFSL